MNYTIQGLNLQLGFISFPTVSNNDVLGGFTVPPGSTVVGYSLPFTIITVSRINYESFLFIILTLI